MTDLRDTKASYMRGIYSVQTNDGRKKNLVSFQTPITFFAIVVVTNHSFLNHKETLFCISVPIYTI